MDDWSRRTPESLHRAVGEFSEAIRLYPAYAEAYVGLANCYNLLREFTRMPQEKAYPLARTAAEHALRLNDNLASAHVALAFVYANWDWDIAGAEREYRRAIALDPGSDLNHHWFATFLDSRGRFEEALVEFDKALAISPGSAAIRADRGLGLYLAGRKAEGKAEMLAVEREDPTFLSPHRYMAGIHLMEGRDQEFLRESEIAAKLTDDRQRLVLVAATRAGLTRAGRPGMLQAMLAEQLRQYKFGAATAYSVAEIYAVMGKDQEALAWLDTAIDRREPDSAFMKADIYLAPLRDLSGYRTLASMIRPASA
jgi:tetratricopeptide (TPR) repeat protein